MIPKKALVVEDSEFMRTVYGSILQKYEGCSIVYAENGQVALDKLKEQPDIDLILLDINMPVMNGSEFLKIIKSDGILSLIPVIIVSSEGNDEQSLKVNSMGAEGYILKPLKAERLYEIIESL